MTEQTYWNGMPTPARRGTAIVADAPQFPAYWARDLVGQRIDVVEVILDFVNAGGGITYLDDRHGYGWTKVTAGHGGPDFDHASTEIEPGSFTPHAPTALAAEPSWAHRGGVRPAPPASTFHRSDGSWVQGVMLHLTDPRDSLKMLRETLSAVQNGAAGVDQMKHSERIGRIIAEIDRQRPIGSNGKHGDRHTETCGCRVQPEPRDAPSEDGHLITDCEHGINSLYERCVPCEAIERLEDEHLPHLDRLGGDWNQVARDIRDTIAALRAAGGVR